MKCVAWRRVLRCTCALACISCADTLGLHDLVEGQDAGDRPAASTPSSDGGEALVLEASTSTGTDPGDAVPEASAPAATSSNLTMVGVADAAAPTETDPGTAVPVTGPMPAVDGAPPEPDMGPTAPESDGAATDCSCGAAPCTVHSNGVGQTFEDCVPSGTHDETQALAACTAFTGTSASCTIQSCPGGGGGPGKSPPGQAACSTGASVCDCWTFSGAEAGLVQSMNSKKCDPCANGGTAWN
jgi:hypothetical protein